MLTINLAHQIIKSIYGKPDRFFSFKDHKEFLSLKDKYLVNGIINPLNGGNYDFAPFVSYRVPKENGGHRIVYQSATLKDEIVLIYLHRYLLTIIGPILPNYVIGYRKKKDNPNGILKAIQSAIAFSSNRLGEWAIKADIKSFYDSIDKIKMLSAISHAQQNYYLEESAIKAIGRLIKFPGPGLPTGLSPVNDLANLYLLSFDQNINQKAIAYYRYGDDIILIGKDRPESAIQNLTEKLSDCGLTVSPEKTKLLAPSDSFDYIGYRFESGKMNFKKSTIKRIQRKALSIINKPVYRKLSLNNLEGNRYLLSFFFYEINNLLADSPIKSRMKYFVLAKNDYPFLKIDAWLVSHIRHKITGSWSGKAIRQAPYRIFSGFGFISSHCLFHKMERASLAKNNLFNRLLSQKGLEQAFLHYFKPSTISLKWRGYFVNRKANSIKLLKEIKNNDIQFEETYEKKNTGKPIISHSIGEKVVLRVTHLYLKRVLSLQLSIASSSVYDNIGSAIRLMRLFDSEQNNYRLLRIDLDGVHERLDRGILQEKLNDISINNNIKQIINSLFGRFKQSEIAGLPRGTPINNILLETYLSLIDSFLKKTSVMFIRTADDFLIIYDNNDSEFLNRFALYLKKLNMVWDEKRFFHIDKERKYAVEYLGYLFVKKSAEPLLITIDRFNLAQFKRKIEKLTKRNKKRTIWQTIKYINNLIKAPNQRHSFIKYYSRINDFYLLGRLDDYICDRIRVAVFKRFRLKDRHSLTNTKLHRDYGLVDIIKMASQSKKVIARRQVLGYIGNTDPRFASKARAL